MYIIAIGWLYITVLMAASENSITAGLLTLIFYGLLPLALFLFVFGTPAKRRARIEAARKRLPQEVVGEVVGDEHRGDAERNE